MITYGDFLENLDNIKSKIAHTCALVGRSVDSVMLLPVTKTYPAEILKYVSRAKLGAVGENRVHEAAEKKSQAKVNLQWELIGHLQTNKITLAIKTFDRIQSVDSLKLLSKLNEGAAINGRVLPILLQVNAGNDPAKYGLKCDEVSSVFEYALGLNHVKVEGLMTIPALNDDIDITERTFNKLREVRDGLSERFKVALPELSMGMSADFVPAIKAGSTIVRIGSGLFGARTKD